MNFLKRVLVAVLATFIIGTPLVEAATVTVDYGTTSQQNNLSGFLHATGVNAAGLTPLKPAILRYKPSDTTARDKAIALGAILMPVISDDYGYPGGTPAWAGNPAPYSDSYATWDALVQTFITNITPYYTSYGTDKIYINIWNEPDTYVGNFFWDGTAAQYYELYRRAYVAIKAALPTAKIGGPTLSSYSRSNITAFLNYCYQHSLVPAYVDWHSLNGYDANIPAVATDIATIKNLYHGYPGFTAAKMVISESVGNDSWLRPASILGWLYEMEQGGADYAVKACWVDVTTNTSGSGQNSCFNGGVDGIFNASDGGKRAGYWVYKTYADGVDTTTTINRVATTSDDTSLVALASRAAATGFDAQVLLGYFGASATIDATVNLSNLDDAGITGGNVVVTVYKVPNDGEAVVSAMTLVSTSTETVTANAATVSLTGIGQYEEYVIYLSNP